MLMTFTNEVKNHQRRAGRYGNLWPEQRHSLACFLGRAGDGVAALVGASAVVYCRYRMLQAGMEDELVTPKDRLIGKAILIGVPVLVALPMQ